MAVTTTYHVVHTTTYRYSRPMSDGYTVATLMPRPTALQDVLATSLVVEPAADERDERVDLFGNRIVQVGVHRPHDVLTLTAESSVAVHPAGEPPPGPPWEQAAAHTAALRGDAALEIGSFTGSSRFVDLATLGDALRSLAATSFAAGRPTVDALRALCDDIHTTFVFARGFSEVSTPLRDVLAARRGVCQDFAHLAVGCVRAMGLAARYVSGYIETQPPPGSPRLVGADASHAWCSAWVPDVGWVDFDPTNQALPVARHVTTAWGRDYGDVTPVRGVVIGPPARQDLTVAVDVTRR